MGDYRLNAEEVRFNAQFMRWYSRRCGRAALPYELLPDGRLKRRYLKTWIATRGYITLRQIGPLKALLRERAAKALRDGQTAGPRARPAAKP